MISSNIFAILIIRLSNNQNQIIYMLIRNKNGLGIVLKHEECIKIRRIMVQIHWVSKKDLDCFKY